MADKPISLGSMILTLIEPHPGHEVAYNRWYEEDHLYAILLGPSAIAGTRFVARRQEKAGRRVADTFDPSRGSLLAVYWLIGDGSDHTEWRKANVERLENEGRFYRERDLVLRFVGRLAFSVTRPSHPVPVELALDHRYPHLAMTVIQTGDGAGGEQAARWYRERFGPIITAPGSPVALCAGFLARRTPDPRKVSGPPDEGGVADDLIVLWFCDTDPSALWDGLVSTQARVVGGSGTARVVWVSPFVATEVGTDRYMDQLSPGAWPRDSGAVRNPEQLEPGR